METADSRVLETFDKLTPIFLMNECMNQVFLERLIRRKKLEFLLCSWMYTPDVSGFMKVLVVFYGTISVIIFTFRIKVVRFPCPNLSMTPSRSSKSFHLDFGILRKLVRRQRSLSKSISPFSWISSTQGDCSFSKLIFSSTTLFEGQMVTPGKSI